MPEKMYHVEGPCPDNETLARALREGNEDAIPMLLSRNESYLAATASELCRRYQLPDLREDLMQEGAIALISAARKFSPDSGAKLLTYAGGAVRSAMLDYLAESSLSLGLPAGRYHQLRRVGYICALSDGATDAELIGQIVREMAVSEKIAGTLLAEYRTILGSVPLEDATEIEDMGADPARIYDERMRRMLLVKLMGEVLRPRELNIVRCHLGFDQLGEREMTFAELAVFLNYNGPSAAEKAFKVAIRKVQDSLAQGEYGVWMNAKRMLREALRERFSDLG